MAIGQHFPLVRLVLLIEAGTHLICDALICPYHIGERRRALKLVRSIGADTLLMWERGLHSFRMVRVTLAGAGHDLGRVPANAKFSEFLQRSKADYYICFLQTMSTVELIRTVLLSIPHLNNQPLLRRLV